MKRRFLGIVCLLYSFIIIYVWMFDKLKNFLAPNMQIYIKLSLLPMIVMSIIMLLNNKVHYKFKFSDLILILPIIMLIFAGNGRLSSGFANNRMTNFNIKQSSSTNEYEIYTDDLENTDEYYENIEKETEPNEDSIKEEDKTIYDFTNPYFDVVDASYDMLGNYFIYEESAKKFEGKTIRVRGFAVKDIEFISNGFSALGKYSISCCAADAGFVGFVIKYDKSSIKNDAWYEVEGVLRQGKDKEGYNIMYIEVINIKEIDSKKEEQYVYPCYSYDDGKCSELSKYDL